MKFIAFFFVAVLFAAALGAQEQKPVPKNSARVFVPGCSKGYVFTAARAAEDRPGGNVVPEGTHLRMSGPKEMMKEIKGQEGSMIEITGLIKKGQIAQDGVAVGGGVRITGATPPTGGSSVAIDPSAGQIMIDVEGWRRVLGECPSR
jgi:hypothetical protein